jgi:hypothetical protein
MAWRSEFIAFVAATEQGGEGEDWKFVAMHLVIPPHVPARIHRGFEYWAQCVYAAQCDRCHDTRLWEWLLVYGRHLRDGGGDDDFRSAPTMRDDLGCCTECLDGNHQ